MNAVDLIVEQDAGLVLLSFQPLQVLGQVERGPGVVDLLVPDPLVLGPALALAKVDHRGLRTEGIFARFFNWLKSLFGG